MSTAAVPDASGAGATPAAEPPAASPPRELRFALLATTAFAVLVGALLARHATWRDELQAWAIVRDSSDLSELFSQLRYEGHPALWYLLLWVPAHVTRSIVALQVIQWVCAVAGAFAFLRYAPFSRTTRLLLAFSYFPLFEYGVIARSYVLVWLITVATLALLPRRAGLYALGIGAALLANTTVLAIPLAGALVIGVLADRAVQPNNATRAARMFAVAVPAVGAAVALFTARPAADAQHATTTLAYNSSRFASNGRDIASALIPFPREFAHFWDSTIFSALGWVGLLVSAGCLIGIAWVVRRRPSALITWCMTALAIPVILYSRDLYGSARFCGVIFVAAIAALWLAQRSDPAGHAVPRTANALGISGAIGSAIAVVGAFLMPFTGAAEAADWIDANAAPGTTIACDTAFRCSSVGIRLDRPTHAANAPGPFTFVVFRSPQPTPVAPVGLAARLADATQRPVVLLTARRPSDARAQVKRHTRQSIVADETFWISIVEPQARR